MARFGSIGTQYFDNSGNPLSGGKLYLYESGTTTAKPTYSDVNMTIPNTHPIVLDAAGRLPDVFFSGAAKGVLKSSAGVQIGDEVDPVGEMTARRQFAEYNALIRYDQNNVVLASDGEWYISLVNNNTGNDPTASPAKWAQVQLIQATAAEGAKLEDIAGLSLTDGNIIVADGSNFVAESGNTARQSLGVAIATKGGLLAGTGSGNISELAVGGDGLVPIADSGEAFGIRWGVPSTTSVNRSEKTSAYTVQTTDNGDIVEATSGTWTLTLPAAATATDGFFFYFYNAGAGDITIDPNGAETIDGLTSFVSYPGEARLIQCDGTAWHSVVLLGFNKTFTSSGTYTKPPGYQRFAGLAYSGGASGEVSSGGAGGGGGGGCFPFNFPASDFGTTETVTVGAGGSGNLVSGGDTSIGSLFTVVGGSAAGGGIDGTPSPTANTNTFGFGGAEANGGFSYSAEYGGGASAGDGSKQGGGSVFGGAAGGGVNSGGTVQPPGSSVFGGDGGAAASGAGAGTAGSIPSGGGGASQTGTSGDGGRGEVRIWGLV